VEAVETGVKGTRAGPGPYVSVRMSDRFHSAWINQQVARTIDLWQESARDPLRLDPAYSPRDHEAREIAYDAEARAVEWELRRAVRERGEGDAVQSRIVASLARFARQALDLEPEAVDLLTADFLPAGIDFARRAHQFDPDLSRSDTIQACRNAWTACGLQPLMDRPSRITPSILGYSLLYPYTDNYLDAPAVPATDKITFCHRFRTRLRGGPSPSRNPHEAAVWALVGMIESEYPRNQFPQVYECLLAIHQAQEASIAQLRASDPVSDSRLLELSFAKGGTSVLADAGLARGSMTALEAEFAFAWGALLQLGDDLQDVRDDLRRGSTTLFTRAVLRGEPLEGLVTQLLGLCHRVAGRMDELGGPEPLKDLLRMSWRSLILAAVAEAHEHFPSEFLAAVERSSPFRFAFQRARRRQLAGDEGLYANLFDLFVGTPVMSSLERPGRRNAEVPFLQAAVE
jgi:hypothetical protein